MTKSIAAWSYGLGTQSIAFCTFQDPLGERTDFAGPRIDQQRPPLSIEYRANVAREVQSEQADGPMTDWREREFTPREFTWMNLDINAVVETGPAYNVDLSRASTTNR